MPARPPALDLPFVVDLYREHAADLRVAVAAQRELLATRPDLRPQLDDVEAELTYLLVRHFRPATVIEIGTFHGWSTTWLLRALRDNGHGHLHSFDRVDHVLASVPDELAADRWTFTLGDVRERLATLPAGIDYAFVDADHGARFARWYLSALLPRLAPGTPVSVHDVLRGATPRPWSEGSVVTRRLRERGTPTFSASRKGAPEVLARLDALRAELALTGARGTRRNPMIWFRA